MYQSELCDADRRGRLVSSEPLFVGVGIVIAYFFDYGMSFVGGPIAWRVPIACQTFFAFVVIGLVFGLPESPRYVYNVVDCRLSFLLFCFFTAPPATWPIAAILSQTPS
jgi:hypothetical protein